MHSKKSFSSSCQASFGMPKLEIPVPKGKVTFSVAQSGFISYRNSPEFNSKFAKPSLPKNEAQAKKLAQEWMQKADEALAKVHLLKQVNFPPLFNQFEFVAANPVTSIENTFADYWSVTFQVFLQTGIKIQKKIPLQGSCMELMLGTNGRIIGLEYNHLPIKKSQLSHLYNLLPEIQEPATGTGAVLQTRNPNTGQAPPPTQEIQKLPPQELPQIVYNLNPDTGIIAPYFLSTKGEIPACKEANRVRRMVSVFSTGLSGVKRIDEKYVTPKGFRVTKSLVGSTPSINGGKKTKTYNLNISANFIFYSDQLNLNQLNTFSINVNQSMQQSFYAPLVGQDSDDANIDFIYNVQFLFNFSPVLQALSGAAAGTVDAALFDANLNVKSIRGNLLNNYFYIHQVFPLGAGTNALGGNSGMLNINSAMATVAHEIGHMLGYCNYEQVNRKAAIASGNKDDWTHNHLNRQSIMASGGAGRGAIRMAELKFANYGSGVPRHFNGVERVFGCLPTNYIYAQTVNNILNTSSQVLNTLPNNSTAGFFYLRPIQPDFPAPIGKNIFWSFPNVPKTNDSWAETMQNWARNNSRFIQTILLLISLFYFTNVNNIANAQNSSAYLGEIEELFILAKNPNYMYYNPLNQRFSAKFKLFSRKETKDKNISFIKASITCNIPQCFRDSFFLRKYNNHNQIIYEAQSSYDCSGSGVSEMFIFRTKNKVDSVMEIFSKNFSLHADWGVGYLIHYPKKETFSANEFIASKSGQKYTPANIYTFFKAGGMSDLKKAFFASPTFSQISSTKNKTGRIIKTKVRQVQKLGLSGYSGVWATDTIISQYNKQGLLLWEQRNISITDSVSNYNIVKSTLGKIPLTDHYYYNKTGKIIKITREFLAEIVIKSYTQQKYNGFINEKARWKTDTISELYFYDTITDSLIKTVKYKTHQSLSNFGEESNDIFINTKQYSPHKITTELKYDSKGRIIKIIKKCPYTKTDTKTTFSYFKNSYQFIYHDYTAIKEGRRASNGFLYFVIREKDRFVEYTGGNTMTITDLMPGTKSIPLKRTEYDFSHQPKPKITEHIFTYEYFK